MSNLILICKVLFLKGYTKLSLIHATVRLISVCSVGYFWSSFVREGSRYKHSTRLILFVEKYNFVNNMATKLIFLQYISEALFNEIYFILCNLNSIQNDSSVLTMQLSYPKTCLLVNNTLFLYLDENWVFNECLGTLRVYLKNQKIKSSKQYIMLLYVIWKSNKGKTRSNEVFYIFKRILPFTLSVIILTSSIYFLFRLNLYLNESQTGCTMKTLLSLHQRYESIIT